MSITEKPTGERRDPFNRADCVAYSVRTFSPSVFSIIDTKIHERYLPDDFYQRGKWSYGLRSLDTAVAGLIDPGGSLTDEFSEERQAEIREKATQTKRAFGVDILARAHELGIVTTLSVDDAQNSLAVRPQFSLDKEIVREYGNFQAAGWDVFPAKEREIPVLLVPSMSEDKPAMVDSVNLDELFEADPEFLQQKIKDLELKDTMSNLASSVAYNLSLHGVSPQDLLPTYLTEIAQIADPDQRDKEIGFMLDFIGRMERLGGDFRNIAYNLFQGFNRTSVKMNGFSAYAKEYLNHMAGCPTESDETHQNSAQLMRVANGLNIIHQDAIYSPNDLATETNPTIDILRNPASYILFLDSDERRLKDEKNDAQRMADFIKKSRGVTDQAQVLELLQASFPVGYETLMRFKEWLGTDYSGASKFNKLVSNAANHIPGNLTFNLEDFNAFIRRELSYATMGIQGEFPGVYKEPFRLERSVTVYDQELQILIPLLAIKTAQANAAGKLKESSGDYYRKQIEVSQGLADELEKSVQKRVKRFNKGLQNVASRREALMTFKENAGITDLEIDHLVELSRIAPPKDGWPQEYDTLLFSALLNGLQMSKAIGEDYMRPNVFKKLLAAIFPHTPETIWQNL